VHQSRVRSPCASSATLGNCCSPRAIHKQQPLCLLDRFSSVVFVTFSCLFVVLSSISMSLDVYLSISHLFFRNSTERVNGRLALERRFGYSRSSRISCGIVCATYTIRLQSISYSARCAPPVLGARRLHRAAPYTEVQALALHAHTRKERSRSAPSAQVTILGVAHLGGVRGGAVKALAGALSMRGVGVRG